MHFALFLQQNSIDPEQARKIALAMMGILPIIVLIFIAIRHGALLVHLQKGGLQPLA